MNPIVEYCLKYYNGINYKLIDPKKTKDEAYIKHVL